MDEKRIKEESSEKTPPKKRRRLWLKILLVLFVLFLTATFSCSYYVHSSLKNGGYLEEWNESVDGASLIDVKYGDEDWEVFDVYIPRESRETQRRGAVLFIHGGAWVGGTRSEQVGFAKRAAKAGYLTANMEYMFFSESNKDSYTIERVLDEVDAAILKLKEIGAKYGYEIDRVALSGHSAGGHITALYAFSRYDRSPLPIAFDMPRVPPIDFHAETWKATGNVGAPAAIVACMTGTEIDANAFAQPDEKTEALINAVSPVHYVKEGVPPTIAAFGAKDMVVPFENCRKLKTAFESLGAKGIAEVAADDDKTQVFDLLVYPNSNHMLGRDPDYTERLWSLFLTYAERYLDAPKVETPDAAAPTSPEDSSVETLQ